MADHPAPASTGSLYSWRPQWSRWHRPSTDWTSMSPWWWRFRRGRTPSSSPSARWRTREPTRTCSGRRRRSPGTCRSCCRRGVVRTAVQGPEINRVPPASEPARLDRLWLIVNVSRTLLLWGRSFTLNINEWPMDSDGVYCRPRASSTSLMMGTETSDDWSDVAKNK